jgi:4-hydroxybenzoate polyprenyltransferase
MTGRRLGVDSRPRIAADLPRCIKEARPSVLGVHLIRFSVGASMAAQLTGHWAISRACAGAVSWEAAVCSVYLFNGAMDVREDRVNGSRRPIASGTLSRSAALLYAAAAAAASLVCAAFLGAMPACVVLGVLVAGWQYSAKPCCLKRHPAGTACVGGILGVLAYLAGYSAQAGAQWPRPHLGPLIFVLAMSGWMALVGAPAKDLPDVAGDAAAGRRTLPLIWGETATLCVIGAAAMATSAVLCVAAAVKDPVLWWPAAAVCAGTLAIACASLGRMWAGNPSRRRRPYRIFMVTQYAANIFTLVAMSG